MGCQYEICQPSGAWNFEVAPRYLENLGTPGGWGSQISRQSAHEGGKVVSPTHRHHYPPETFLVLISVRGLSRPQDHSAAGRPARPRTQHDCHHDTKVKPEPATAVIELLTMGGKTPETCWAIHERQDNKLENGCIWLVIFLSSNPNFLISPPPFFLRSKSLKFVTRSSLWQYVPKLQVNQKWVEEKSGLVTEVVLA